LCSQNSAEGIIAVLKANPNTGSVGFELNIRRKL